MSTIVVSNINDGTTTVPATYVTNGSAKAWVNFSGEGTPAITNSFNGSSITDNGLGKYTLAVSSSFSDTTYVIATQATKLNTNTAQRTYGYSDGDTKTASSIYLRCQAVSDSSFQDEKNTYVIFFGDLA